MYEWALKDLGRLGWIAAFIYCAGAALRLARFNTTLEVMDKRYFQGLPSPAAAALVAGFIWVAIDSGFSGSDFPLLAAAATIFAGVTMVTNVRFYSFKDINLRKSVPFVVVAAIALVFALMALRPEVTLFGFFVIYALSGYVLAIIRMVKRKTGTPGAAG
jgi:CDP-diacylglycerol--serine O-phosphatidyltransferase